MEKAIYVYTTEQLRFFIECLARAFHVSLDPCAMLPSPFNKKSILLALAFKTLENRSEIYATLRAEERAWIKYRLAETYSETWNWPADQCFYLENNDFGELPLFFGLTSLEHLTEPA